MLRRSQILATRTIAIAAIVFGAVGLVALGHYETSGESWGYWLFARVFEETGSFVNPDRGAIYAVYLVLFRWMGFPAGVTVEHLISGTIAFTAMAVLFRQFIGLRLAILVALAWIPFVQTAEPSLQKLALAASLFGLAVRRGGSHNLVYSYALFGLAYLLRPSYIILLMVFPAWDLYNLVRDGTLQWLIRSPRRAALIRPSAVMVGWPIYLLVALSVWFGAVQSPNPWNNGWFASTQWFPVSNTKSLRDGHFIQAWNWRYVDYKYGSHVDKDFYFTNEELFDGADSAFGAIRANPGFIVKDLLRSIKPAIHSMAKLTELRLLPGSKWFEVLLPFLLVFGALRLARDTPTRLFVVASVIITVPSVILIPTPRLYVPVIPVMVLGSAWYGLQLRNLLLDGPDRLRRALVWLGLGGLAFTTAYFVARSALSPQPGLRTIYALLVGYAMGVTLILAGWERVRVAKPQLRRVALGVVVAIPLLLFTTGFTQWAGIAKELSDDLRRGEIKILERPDTLSMAASFKELEPLVRNCRGVLSLEYLFVAAFMDIPTERVYDIWEIPPFGQLGDSEYDGLRPDRIDCVLVSEHLPTSVGHATNVQLRYDGYIEPYVEQLKELGAAVHDVDGFGQVIVLQNKG